MATTASAPAIYGLPPEITLQVAGHLQPQAASDLVNLRNFCLISKKLLPIAQEVLYTNAILPVACGCHPTVNSALQLLRTLLERPTLAEHVKALRFSVVRRNVAKLYRDEYPKKKFDLPALRKMALDELSKMGFSEAHPWWASLKNNVESAYAGLLLCTLPNLTKLQYTIKELHRGMGVEEPISALYGTSSPPAALEAIMKTTLQELSMFDLVFLRSMAFEKLNVLKITSVSVPILLQLNGPNTFRGTTQLSELWVGLSVYLLDEHCLNEMQISFKDLIDALGCHRLSTLKVTLEHENYCALHNPKLDVQSFVNQLSCLESTLKVLEIDLNRLEEPEEWDFILAQCKSMTSSLRNFSKLELLKIPQDFLFSNLQAKGKIMPQDLPEKLQCLKVVAPDRSIATWARSILEEPEAPRELRKIFLYCRDEVNTSAEGFSKNVQPVWPTLLSGFGIQSYIVDFKSENIKSLSALYEDHPDDTDAEYEWEEDPEEFDEGEDDDESDYGNDEEDLDDDSDEDMPDLEPQGGGDDSGSQTALGVVVDEMD